MKLSTKLIHAGVEPDPSTGAIMTPIYQTSTYVQSAPGVHKGYEYARSQNPTRSALESALAHIENGRHGLCYSSGVAATDAVLRLLAPGDEVIAANDMYGGTYRLFTKIFEKAGIRFHFVDMQDAYDLSGQQRKVEDMRSAQLALVPLDHALVFADEIDNDGIKRKLRFGYRYPERNAPFYEGQLMMAELQANWTKVGTFGKFMVYRKLR